MPLPGGGGNTVIRPGPEVAVLPPLSVALAVSTSTPGEALVQMKVNGLWVVSPSLEPLLKNSTLLTTPSMSNAAVVIVTFRGNWNVAPSKGLVIRIVGGKFNTVVTAVAELLARFGSGSF